MKSKRYDGENKVAGTEDTITVQEAGRRGGIATRDRQGIEFLKSIGVLGQKAFATRYTLADRSRWGRMGGRPAKRGISLGKRANNMRNGGMGSPLGSLPSFPSDEKTTLNSSPCEEKVVCGPSKGTYEEGKMAEHRAHGREPGTERKP